jgi:hypothetical protein
MNDFITLNHARLAVLQPEFTRLGLKSAIHTTNGQPRLDVAGRTFRTVVDAELFLEDLQRAKRQARRDRQS